MDGTGKPEGGQVVCYLGDGVLVSEDAEEELGGGLSLAVCDWTVAVHDQVLLDPRRQVLLPARLHDTHSQTHATPTANIKNRAVLTLQQ